MKFWGKDRKQDNWKNIWIEHLNIDTGNWFQVFSACLGKMIAIQTFGLILDNKDLYPVTGGFEWFFWLVANITRSELKENESQMVRNFMQGCTLMDYS